jgi:hypothetical protein
MATDSRTGGTTPPPDVSNLRASVTDAFAQADDAAAGRVQLLQRVYQARASQLARAAADVKAEPGANEADVTRAEDALSAAKAVSSQLGLMHQRLTTPEPNVPVEGWVLHGHVFTAVSNAEPKPVAGFTVFLVDAAQAYRQTFGFAYTDAAGYFLLKHAGDAEETRAVEVFVEVADLKARPVYLSKTPFQPANGVATYQSVMLREGSPPLGEPPGDVRRPRAPKREPQS